MKENKYLILFLSLLMTTVSCEKLLLPVTFDVKIQNYKDNYKVGDSIIFDIEGNPDYITFFSGESGHEFKNRFRTEIDKGEIDSIYLNFDYMTQYGYGPNPLTIYLSNNFPGFSRVDTIADSLAIINSNWINVNKEINFSDIKFGVQLRDFKVDLTDYIDGCVCAFRYQWTTVDAVQYGRKANITNMSIWMVQKNGSKNLVSDGYAMGLVPYDMLVSNSSNNPYFANGGYDSWDLRQLSKNSILFASSTKSNDDWVISKNLKLNSTNPDKGIVIKDITKRVNEYVYSFPTPGRYIITFLAGNVNIEGESTKIVEYTINVTQ